MITKQTTLDLNGPILSFVQQPESITVCAGSAATFVGIVTATFLTLGDIENPASNTGSITYRWYDQSGPLFDDPPASGGDGLTISGAATTTLTLYNNTITRNLYLRADYVFSAYGVPGVAVTAGTARSTGNAINEPLDSNIAALNLDTSIVITSEPLDATVAQSNPATFSLTASATDGTNQNLSYQWQLNGNSITDNTTSVNSVTPSSATITVTDDLGGSTVIDFSNISTYSNFISGRTYTLVSSDNVETLITASGAGGGRSIERSVSGGSGGKSLGTFTFIEGTQYKLRVGGAGVDGGAGGFSGGGNGGGGSGRAGGGGGFTGLFLNSVSHSNAILIAGGGGGGSNDPAGGGAGGGSSGGNSGNAGTRGGFGGTQTSGGAGGSGGAAGSALQGGSGAGGGGGGYYGGGGGTSASICCEDGAGGGGSGYLHPTLLTDASYAVGEGSATSTDGTFKIDLITTQVSSTTLVFGSQTKDLTISSSEIGLNQVNCIVSHPTACNSPLTSRSSNFTVVAPRDIINFEAIGGNLSTAILSNVNLENNTFTYNTNTNPSEYNNLCFYAPEKDVNLELEIYGAKGLDFGSYVGGQGGYSKVRFVAKKNEEYVITPLPQENQIGAVYIYRKSNLIISVGSGGNAGSGGNGGNGGGVNVAGASGNGRGAGGGGVLIAAGTLSQDGVFGSNTNAVPLYNDTKSVAPNGGRTTRCARGTYYGPLGVPPCDDLGQVQFTTQSGILVTNSAVINRGFKMGYGVRQTSGLKIGNGGNGGNGTTGGQGGSDVGGGGGGSGYSDGSITIVSTQQGGSSGIAQIIFRSF